MLGQSRILLSSLNQNLNHHESSVIQQVNETWSNIQYMSEKYIYPASPNKENWGGRNKVV